MRMILLAALGAFGCSSSNIGPSAEAEDAALSIVWDQVYAMPTAKRPTVTWTSDCTGNLGVVANECDCDSVFTDIYNPSTDYVHVQWFGTIAKSCFAEALEFWKVDQVYPPNPTNLPEIVKARTALTQAGL